VPFALARDGDTILALTDSHGTWLQWLPAKARTTRNEADLATLAGSAR